MNHSTMEWTGEVVPWPPGVNEVDFTRLYSAEMTGRRKRAVIRQLGRALNIDRVRATILFERILDEREYDSIDDSDTELEDDIAAFMALDDDAMYAALRFVTYKENTGVNGYVTDESTNDDSYMEDMVYGVIAQLRADS